MRLAPRYDGPAMLTVDGLSTDQLRPLSRQRRRMQAMLAGLTHEEWLSASRCDGWTTRDVVCHLVGVNAFWRGSVLAGLAGKPTRVLSGFDPAATPPLMVDSMSAFSADEVLDQFVSSNEAFLNVLEGLSDEGWSTVAESPVGHVPIRLLAQHALWDCWVHERDVAIPLGIAPVVQTDEVRSCLQYAAAVSPALGIGVGHRTTGTFSVEANDPHVRFMLDVGESVSVRDVDTATDAPCLRGDAVTLVDALSLRAAMPASTPSEWSQLLVGLTKAFDAD